MDRAGWSLIHFLDEVKEWHFNNTSNEVIWPKKFSNSMHGSKSAILAIFQTGPWWPCTASAALKNPSQDFKNSFCIGYWWIPSNAGRLEWPYFFKIQSGEQCACPLGMGEGTCKWVLFGRINTWNDNNSEWKIFGMTNIWGDTYL